MKPERSQISSENRDIAIDYQVNAAITSWLSVLRNDVPQMREQSEVS